MERWDEKIEGGQEQGRNKARLFFVAGSLSKVEERKWVRGKGKEVGKGQGRGSSAEGREGLSGKVQNLLGLCPGTGCGEVVCSEK